MNGPTQLHLRMLACLTGCCAGLLVCAPRAAAAPAPSAKDAKAAPAPAKPTNTPPAVVEIPKSVFGFNPKAGGKDPFFPKTTRFDPPKPKVVAPPPGTPPGPGQVAPAPPPPPPPPPPASSFFTLKGVMGAKSPKPIAIINTTVKNYEMEAGEELSVKIPNSQAKVRCLEIKEQSIIVNITDADGKSERIELRVRRGI